MATFVGLAVFIVFDFVDEAFAAATFFAPIFALDVFFVPGAAVVFAFFTDFATFFFAGATGFLVCVAVDLVVVAAFFATGFATGFTTFVAGALGLTGFVF